MQTTEAAAVKKGGITTRELVIDAMLIALTYIFTAFVNLRLPIAANGGLIHLGNVPLFLAAIIFGRRTGTLAGAFGMGLFDLLSGWYLWAPFTFVIEMCIRDRYQYPAYASDLFIRKTSLNRCNFSFHLRDLHSQFHSINFLPLKQAT